MHYEITYIDPTTGEPDKKELTQENCWEVLNAVYSATIPEKKIKPVNFKLEFFLEGE